MAKDAVYEGEREVRTFVDLSHGSDELLMKTEEGQRGNYYTTMGSILLRAFTFEAYLNHLGHMSIEYWEDIESIKVMDKYSVLCKKYGINPDFSRRPYQTIKGLFKFRNAIAHGKSVVLTEVKEVSSKSDPYDHEPKAHWEEYCSPENAGRAKEDVKAVIEELHAAAGLGKHPFMFGVAFGSLTSKAPNKQPKPTP